ncbi:MAG TPA: GIY-YIG nuclease family protein [Clostridia bacterium]|nr:GIY-YIG nuclease family protein [Clostridia bacterium]
MDRKKQLKEQFKSMKPAMGIMIIRSKVGNKCFLQPTQNLRGAINSTRFKLDAGIHPNRALQRDWHQYGADSFAIEVLAELEYDRDETKTDYTEELAILQMIWEERLLKEDMEFY